MLPGRCITAEYANSMGCYADVTEHLKELCEGEVDCSLMVASLDVVAQPCGRDFKSYLEMQYQCVTVTHLNQCLFQTNKEINENNNANNSNNSNHGNKNKIINNVNINKKNKHNNTINGYLLYKLDRKNSDKNVNNNENNKLKNNKLNEKNGNKDSKKESSKTLPFFCYLTTQPGKRFNITWLVSRDPPLLLHSLLDLETSHQHSLEEISSPTSSSSSSSSPCSLQWHIVDGTRTHHFEACTNQRSQKFTFLSATNQISFRFFKSFRNQFYNKDIIADVKSPAVHSDFYKLSLFQYEVIGCAHIDVPAGATLKRMGENLAVVCNTSGQVWHLRCQHGEWLGPLGNCSVPLKISSGLKLEMKLDRGVLTAIFVGVLLGGAFGALMLSIIFVLKKRDNKKSKRKKPEIISNNNNNKFIELFNQQTCQESLKNSYADNNRRNSNTSIFNEKQLKSTKDFNKNSLKKHSNRHFTETTYNAPKLFSPNSFPTSPLQPSSLQTSPLQPLIISNDLISSCQSCHSNRSGHFLTPSYLQHPFQPSSDAASQLQSFFPNNSQFTPGADQVDINQNNKANSFNLNNDLQNSYLRDCCRPECEDMNKKIGARKFQHNEYFPVKHCDDDVGM